MAVASSFNASSSFQKKMRASIQRLAHLGGIRDPNGDGCISPRDMVIDASPLPMSNKIALAAGRFWGTQRFVVQQFQERFPGSITSAIVGFMSPYSSGCSNAADVSQSRRPPTYEDVCTGCSGNLEVVLVELSDSSRYMEELLRFFFQMHDPTTKFRQGCDRGFQFASWILCDDAQQLEIASRVRSEVQELINLGILSTYENSKVVTCISPSLQEFTPAPEEHQHYLDKNPQASSPQRLYFAEWPESSWLSGDGSTISSTPRRCSAHSSSSSSSMIMSTMSDASLSSASSSLSFLDEEDLKDLRQRMRALKLLRRARKRRQKLKSMQACFFSWYD